MFNQILFVLFLLQTKTKNCDSSSSVTGVLDYAPSSGSLKKLEDKLNSISSILGLPVKPFVILIQALEVIRKGEKFKDGTVGKADDVKDEVADTAKDAQKGVENAGNKLKNAFG